MTDIVQQERKETPAQRVERIKREKAPWSIMDDIERYAREGFAAIPSDDLTVRFRAWGLYTQGDGRGTRGEEQPFFMMRLRTPNGSLTSEMVHTIADISDRYARSSIDITNRQNFQLHWLRIEDVPTIWNELARVGWTSMGACGDNTRTVTGCPLAGVQHGELIDASPIALAVDSFLNGNPDYANLPRKLKITITGCPDWCTYPEINDIGMPAVRALDGTIGFHARVAGALSTRPHLAVLLPAFVRQDQVLDVVRAIVAIFRDSDELRQNRAKARMKFLFLTHGWTAESFLAEVERRAGYKLDPPAPETIPEGSHRGHSGVRRQKNTGFHYASFSVVSGRITPDQLRHIATLAQQYGDGTIRLTTTQNIIVLNIPESRLADFEVGAATVGVPLSGSPFQLGTLSCTGTEFCKLAITETKHFSIRLAAQMDERLPGFSDAIKLHVTGCPNACGQHWIADVGLQGVLITRDGEQEEGFDFFVGGGLGANRGLARRVGFRAPAQDVAAALERLFTTFLARRASEETFRSWTLRTGDDGVRSALAGEPSVQYASVTE